MPIATPEVYRAMLDRAKNERFAYPAINVSSSQTLHAALKGFADAGSDGIIQVSTGGAEYLSGPSVKNMVTGSLAFAAFGDHGTREFFTHVRFHKHEENDRIVIHVLVELYARSSEEATEVLEEAARGELTLTSLAEESRPPASSGDDSPH